MLRAIGTCMQEHAGCQKGYVNKESVIVMEPVPDPQGLRGMAVIEVNSKNAGRSIIAQNPMILSDLGFWYEVYLMLRGMMRK